MYYREMRKFSKILFLDHLNLTYNNIIFKTKTQSYQFTLFITYNIHTTPLN
jgi:hypothetical protein